jgi:hypothetical protein
MTPSIFQITDDVTALNALLDRLEEEEIEDEAAIDELSEFLASSEELLRQKIDGYVGYYRHLQARAKARREEAKHITQLARYDEKRMDRLKEAVKMASKQLGRPKLEGHTRSVSVSQRERPTVDITDMDALPEEFKAREVSWKADKKAIIDHMMTTGELIDGTEVRQIISVRFR